MARSPQTKNPSVTPRAKKAPPRPRLPDPKIAQGPRRPFTDPGWNEAWWWLGIPVAAAVIVLVSYQIDQDWYRSWMVSEGVGFLEMSQFLIMVAGFAIAVRLLSDPFVRERPLVLAVAALAALSCLYIAGEEVNWGQVLFSLGDASLITEENHSGEFSLHNAYGIFEQVPRTILKIGVFVGGIILPLWCAIAPKWRASRLALFLPAAIVVPTAVGVFLFMAIDILGQKGTAALAARPSEGIEFYLYFFILAYLIVYRRRIAELKSDADKKRS